MVTRLASAAAVAAALAGCNFTEFDDLADEAWVDRVESPDATSSRQYGEALVALPTRTDGSQLVVIGKSRASVSQLGYDAEGKRQAVVAIDPRQTLSFGNFVDNPALAADRDSDRVAFTVVQGQDNVDPTRFAVYDGRALADTPIKTLSLNAQVSVAGTMRHNITSEGVTFANLPGFGAEAEDDLVLTRGPQLIVVQDYALAEGTSTFDLKGCLHGAEWSFGVAVADVLPDAIHAGPEIIVGVGTELKDDASKVLILDPAQITTPYGTPGPCFTGMPLDEIPSSEQPGDLGEVILTAQFPDVAEGDPAAGLADLIYSSPSKNKVFVRFGGGTSVEISPSGGDGSEFGASIATGDLDGDGVPELVIGAPRSDPESVSNAGKVYIYKFRASTNDFQEVATLYAAEPENEQRFGKSVAVAPFGTGDRNVVVAGAEGAVFTYFRTTLYEDVRAGRGP